MPSTDDAPPDELTDPVILHSSRGDRDDPCHGLAALGHEHLFTALDPCNVLAQRRLEL